MKLEQKIINRLAPVRKLLEEGKIIQADRMLYFIIEELHVKITKEKKP